MGGEIDRRPGATTVAQLGGVAAPVSGPGRGSLTAGTTPKTTAGATAGTTPKTTADLGGGPVRVTADRLNVRSSPQVEPGNVLGGLEHGRVVDAVGRDGDWIQINFGGEPAYVSGAFVEPTSPNAADATAILQSGDVPGVRAPDATAPTTAVPSTVASAAPASVVLEPATPPYMSALPPQSTPARAASIFAVQPPGKGEFATASGNAIATTTLAEAAVLNQIRRDPRRLDPTWLVSAQHALAVVDATGAMNTETLRAMREHAHRPRLNASQIMDEAFLTAIAPGRPFHDGVEDGQNRDRQAPDPAATTLKDRVAQSLGYPSFEAYHDTWGTDNLYFLGADMGSPVHSYLRARLRVAEAYLRNRIKSPSGQPLADDRIRKAIGWNGQATASYADLPNKDVNAVHFHALGLAVDIDPAQNPYLYDRNVDEPDFWIAYFEHLFEHATRLYGGDALTAKSMVVMSERMSTEELYQHVRVSSQSFGKLLELSARAHGDESPTGEIGTSLARVGYEGDTLTTATREIATADERFHQVKSRKNAKQVTNQSQELVIALRDVAGLAWGGTEMSPVENGDFMHWDVRLTDMGRAVIAAAAAAKKAAAEAKKTAVKK